MNSKKDKNELDGKAILSAYSKMNKSLTPIERREMNKLRYHMWISIDLLRDLCNAPSLYNDFRRDEAEKLSILLSKIPLLEK